MSWSKSLKILSLLTALAVATPAWAVSDLQDYSTTAGTNTDIGGISVAENAPFANMNNALRELMAELKRGVAGKGTDISSVGGTPAICASGTSQYVDITGTTTITGFGTAAAGCWRIVQFDGALTLTHNATSMILLGGANITTAAGYVGGFISEGSGNWRQVFGSHVPYLASANAFTAAQSISITTAGTTLTMTSTDAGAGAGPNLVLHRDSATPAAADVIPGLLFFGEDSGSTATQYFSIFGQIVDPTDTSEDGRMILRSLGGGSARDWYQESGELVYSTLTPKAQAGAVNATGLYVNGHGTVAQFVSDTDATYTSLPTILPVDDSIPQNTEGDEVLTVAITPTNASSTLMIDVTIHLGVTSAGGDVAAALFVDTTASAIAAANAYITSTGSMYTLTFRHLVSAASTSARTYKVRAGSEVAANAAMNGDGSTRLFGGVAISSLTVTEILPQ